MFKKLKKTFSKSVGAKKNIAKTSVGFKSNGQVQPILILPSCFVAAFGVNDIM